MYVLFLPLYKSREKQDIQCLKKKKKKSGRVPVRPAAAGPRPPPRARAARPVLLGPRPQGPRPTPKARGTDARGAPPATAGPAPSAARRHPGAEAGGGRVCAGRPRVLGCGRRILAAERNNQIFIIFPARSFTVEYIRLW